MKELGTAGKMAYIGTGAGVVLFAVTGLLWGSFLGGAIGLNVTGFIFGTPLGTALLPRMIVGISMLLGVAVTATFYIAAFSAAGWLVGYIVDAVRTGKAIPVEVKH